MAIINYVILIETDPYMAMTVPNNPFAFPPPMEVRVS